MIKKYIPDAVTAMNIVCGILGVVFAFKGKVDIAFPLMLAAAVFDFCDGLCARALDAYSDLGKELDSLCDLVSFGVLPSVLLYNLMKTSSFSESWLCYVPLLITVFSALRLAKFNVDERQHSSFLGLATPPCAMLCGAICYFVAAEPASRISLLCLEPWFIPVLSVVLCALLVLEIPMMSLKIKKDDSRDTKSKRYTFLASCLVCIAFVLIAGLNWSLCFVLIITVYILLNIAFLIFARQ